jgi:hypothetical protein
MRCWKRWSIIGVVVLGCSFPVSGAEPEGPQPVRPKPLSDNIRKGLDWLVEMQNPDGGWGQGEHAGHLRQVHHQQREGVQDESNVADTAMAAMALFRAGSTPAEGPHATAVRRAVEYVCAQVEAAPQEGLMITTRQGTRLQSKLGTHIDTFAAALLLAEVKHAMHDEPARQRVMAALDRTIQKIQAHQKDDGTWDNRGWATVLCQSVATKALNRAAQQGYAVEQVVLERADAYSRAQLDRVSGRFTPAADAAGIELYAAAGNLGGMQQAVNTYALSEVARLAETAETPAERDEARQRLAVIRENEQDLVEAKAAVTRRLNDAQFVAGFGTNGGEEFLSYMHIGESLVVDGGEAWEAWDGSMTENLNRIQNDDGSWSGHHCITGRTFCTSAALMVLMTDRSPVVEQVADSR